ncbi:MAG: glycosyltransferase, partial [Acidimicrobiales bacterium]
FEVAPVGVDLDWLPNRPGGMGGADRAGPAAARWDGGAPVVLWPHRWEHDKDPGAFARAVDRVAAAGIPFRLVLAGEDPDAGSEAAMSIRWAVADRHAARVVAVGPFDVADYRRWLARADVVVSCTRHEWFGVAVVEAVAAGCVPVLPDAHAYPEVIPDRWHNAALYRPGRFGSALAGTLADLASRRTAVAGLAGAVADRYRWPVVAAGYDARIDALVRNARSQMVVRQSR